jgi:HAD superfamily hydrolase (TIGR01549 family)
MILFDLDGTLLPMDQDEFTAGYFRLLAEKMVPHGYDPKELTAAVWAGTKAMVCNDGSCSNEEAFWRTFSGIYGDRAERDRDLFEDFYRQEFRRARELCGYRREAGETIRRLKEAGCRVVLATNPIFPAVATQQRIRWAGLDEADFELVTTYENIGYCKPNPDYYREILRRLGQEPEACVMVGNDVDEDMVARTLGMPVFLMTEWMVNRSGRDISPYPHGGFPELTAYLAETV